MYPCGHTNENDPTTVGQKNKINFKAKYKHATYDKFIIVCKTSGFKMWCKSKTLRFLTKSKPIEYDRSDKSWHVTNFCGPKRETIATPETEGSVVLNEK